ncbi:MAG: hypothetical protein K2X93_00570 [Candidatus Obscuribacterales bacterium]|nr:hypothetical protein [Candidatus Obscuribacterales bacterium]
MVNFKVSKGDAMIYALLAGIALGLLLPASGRLLVTFLGAYVVSALVALAMLGCVHQFVVAYIAMAALSATLFSGVKLVLQLS